MQARDWVRIFCGFVFMCFLGILDQGCSEKAQTEVFNHSGYEPTEEELQEHMEGIMAAHGDPAAATDRSINQIPRWVVESVEAAHFILHPQVGCLMVMESQDKATYRETEFSMGYGYSRSARAMTVLKVDNSLCEAQGRVGDMGCECPDV